MSAIHVRQEAKKTPEFVIVPQTKIAFIGYVMLTIAMIAGQYSSQSPVPMSPMFIVMFAVLAVLGLYVINCTVLGKCNLYAWIVGYVLVVIGALSVLSVVMKLR